MKRYSFRLGITSTIIGTLCIQVLLPMNVCLCADCHCDNSLGFGAAKNQSVLSTDELAREPSPCCCKQQKTQPVRSKSQQNPRDHVLSKDGLPCCLQQDTRCQCHCGEYPPCIATPSNIVSPTNKLIHDSFWKMSINSILPPGGQTDALGLPSFPGVRQGLLWPHVPLHVLLCVFLN